MTTEQQVAKHYTHGSLEQAVLDALSASGKDIERLETDDLAGIDEFHLGWRAATVELAKDLGLSATMHVLDVGSGLGGPARYFAEAYGCRVTGVDLTREFVDVSNALTRRCGLDDRATFQEGSALALPFDDHVFDAVTLIHVGMNIESKAALFLQVRRVLKPGGPFGIYDIMRISDGDLPYPLPWATTGETSFVATLDIYRQLLTANGFTIEQQHNRREFSLKLGHEMRDRAAKNGVPALGVHVIMGPATPQRLGNVMRALEQGIIAPVEIIAREL